MVNLCKRLRLLSLIVMVQLSALGQQKTITGRVADASAPLPGVTVINKNTKAGTTTDAEGNYKINANTGEVLVFSFIGFTTQERTVGTANTIDLTMTVEANNLNEVVVIGYGSAKKKDLTGALTTISSKDFQTGVMTSPEQLIAGKVPGVSIISNSGRPGAGSTILIRGGASLSASNAPLIVLDGVPLDNGDVSGSSNPLSFINPNDIETFTVLKDASAAAIYGTRASNGVILITSKRAAAGGLKVNFSTTNSFANITQKVDVLSPDAFRELINKNGTDAQKAMLGTANTDWQDVIYQTALSTDNYLNFSGGIKGLPYRLSLGYQNQNGVLKTDNLQRSSIGLTLNPVLFNKHLSINISLKSSLQNARFGNGGAIGGAVSFNPTVPVYSGNEKFGGYWEWLDAASPTGLVNLVGRNPLGLLEQRIDKSNPVRTIGNIQLDYKFHFLPDLRANLNVGVDISRGRGTIFEPSTSASGTLAGGNGGTNNQYRQDRDNKVLEFYLSYVKELKSIKSKFDILGGYSYNNYLTTNYNYASFNAKGEKYPNSDPAFPLDKPENTLISYFGRANFTVLDNYLLTATLRRDGSSRFAPANRWGLFPSVALAWNIKDEGFLANSKTVSNLKIRLGYGVTGQQDGIGNYDYLSYYSLSSATASYQFGDKFYQGFRPGGFYASRKWEETATSNIALDYGFFNNRISGSIDFYKKDTKDLLNNIPQPAGANFSAFIVANVGSMENKGVEISLNTQPIKNSKVVWDANFNITRNKNTITNLTVVPQDPNYRGFPSGTIAGGIGGQFAFLNAVGFSRNTFNLYQQVYTEAGKPIEGVFVDQNKDGIINQDDLYKGKSSIPDVFFGFSNNLTFKKFFAGIVMRASVGNYVYNNTFSQAGVLNQFLGNAVIYNGSTNVLETNFRGSSQQLLSDYYLQNASFARIDNINLGYNLGSITKSISNVRINLSAQNVFVITKYKGIDPEINNGIDNNLYPRPRTIALGLSVDL